MGSGGVAIAALPTVICLKVPFSDGLGGGGRRAKDECRRTKVKGLRSEVRGVIDDTIIEGFEGFEYCLCW